MSAALVKELRERTGLGLMECKKALSEAGGDIDAAIEALRKSSGMKAAKKAGGPGFGRSPKGGTPAGKTPSGSGSYPVLILLHGRSCHHEYVSVSHLRGS